MLTCYRIRGKSKGLKCSQVVSNILMKILGAKTSYNGKAMVSVSYKHNTIKLLVEIENYYNSFYAPKK